MRADIKERVAMIERGEVPEGYKKNKSDIIPEEWKVARLGDYVIDMKSGLSRKLNDTDIGLPVIRSNNIADNKVNFSNIKYWYMDDPQGADTKTYFLQDGDILVNFINSISQIGKAAIFRNEVGRNVIFTTNILKMTLCNKLNTSYFLYFSETEEYSNYIKSITKPAINQASFTTVEYKRMDLLIPPVFEQQKISSIISIWHRAIELKDKLLEQKKLQKKGLIQQILRNCFEKCKRKEIKEVAEQRVEINSANVSLPVLSCTKYDGLVSSLEYFRRQVYAENLESYKVVRKNWFAYATNHIEEGSIGLQLQYDAGLVSPMYTVFKLNSGMDEEFVFAILKSEIYRRRFKTMMNASVNRRGSLRWNEFSKIKIPVPEYEMQKRMAQIIRVAENEISLLEKEISLLKNQKKGLMQLLLTGKVRVPC